MIINSTIKERNAEGFHLGTLSHRLERNVVQIPTFDKPFSGTVGLFSSCPLVWFKGVPVHVRIIPPCFSSSCLLYFSVATLQMELNAQEGGVAPWRAVLKNSALWKRSTQKHCVALLVERNSFSKKRLKSWEVENLVMIQHFSSAHSVNNK